MALQARFKIAQRMHLFHREEALFRQHPIKHRRCMTLRQHETVALCPLGRVRADIHLFEVQGRQNFADGQRSARMTGLLFMQNRQHVNAELFAERIELCRFSSS